MTRCPACSSGIDPRAKVCPWCRQRLGFRYDRLAGVIIACALMGFCVFHSENKDDMAIYNACLAKTVDCDHGRLN